VAITLSAKVVNEVTGNIAELLPAWRVILKITVSRLDVIAAKLITSDAVREGWTVLADGGFAPLIFVVLIILQNPY